MKTSQKLKTLLYAHNIEICDHIAELVDEVEELEDDSLFLDCLRANGVDNWSGYECAQEDMTWPDDE